MIKPVYYVDLPVGTVLKHRRHGYRVRLTWMERGRARGEHVTAAGDKDRRFRFNWGGDLEIAKWRIVSGPSLEQRQ